SGSNSIKLQVPRDRFVGWNVDPLHRRFQLADPNAGYKVPLLGDERRHIDDLKQFTFAEVFQHQASQTELDRAPRERVAIWIVVRIPLQAHVRASKRLFHSSRLA